MSLANAKKLAIDYGISDPAAEKAQGKLEAEEKAKAAAL